MKRRIRYQKYEDALNRIGMMERFEDEIAKSSDGVIRVLIADLIKDLGTYFQGLSNGAIYMAMAYLLYKKGIIVKMGSANSGEKLLILRKKGDLDVIPNWLENLLEKDSKLDKDKDRVGYKEAFLKESFDNIYKVDTYFFDMKKLEWKVKRSKLVSNNAQLLELIKDNISRPEERCRIEINIEEKKKNEKKIDKDKDDKGDKKEETKDKDDKGDKKEETKDKDDKGDIKKEETKDKDDKDEVSVPQEVSDKLGSLLLIEDAGQRAAAKYLIQKNAARKDIKKEK